MTEHTKPENPKDRKQIVNDSIIFRTKRHQLVCSPNFGKRVDLDLLNTDVYNYGNSLINRQIKSPTSNSVY